MKQKFNQPAPSGFTLTELLVVIVIIIVLASLSIVGIGKLRDMADKTASIRTLSTLMVANASYAGDHNGQYIGIQYFQNHSPTNPVTRWNSEPAFLRYLRGDLYEGNGEPSRKVPESLFDPKVLRRKNAGWETISASYGMSDGGMVRTEPSGGWPPTGWRPEGHKVSNVAFPSRSMAFATACDQRASYSARLFWDGVDKKTADGRMAYRHGNKALVVFYDGHAGEISKVEMQEIDRTQGGINSYFWNASKP